MLHELERTRKPLHELEERLTTHNESKFGKVEFDVLMEQLEDLRTRLIGESEVVLDHLDSDVGGRAHLMSPVLFDAGPPIIDGRPLSRRSVRSNACGKTRNGPILK